MIETGPKGPIGEGEEIEFGFEDIVNAPTDAELVPEEIADDQDNPIKKKVVEHFVGNTGIGETGFESRNIENEVLQALSKRDFTDQMELAKAVENLDIFADIRNLSDQTEVVGYEKIDPYAGVVGLEKVVKIDGLTIDSKPVEVLITVGYGKNHTDIYCKQVEIK